MVTGGTIVVEERWTFDVVGFQLHDGMIFFVGRCEGPLPAVPVVPRQYVLYGIDGSEIYHSRVGIGWDDIEAHKGLTLVCPFKFTSVVGTAPW